MFLKTQKENVLLVQYKSKLMFKAGIVDPNSMKQQIFIMWSTEEGTACQICLWKICLQEHVYVHIEEDLFWGKGCPLKVSHICFDELPWRFSVLVFQKRRLHKALQSLPFCKGCYLYWKKTSTFWCYTRHSLDSGSKEGRETDISELILSFRKAKTKPKNWRATPAEFSCLYLTEQGMKTYKIKANRPVEKSACLAT